jgi:multiple sugar transport system permease protein
MAIETKVSPVKRTLDYLVMTVITLVFAAPIIYMFIGSFKPSDKVLNGLAGFVPEDTSLQNYTGVFARFDDPSTGYFWRFFLVSLIVTVVAVAGGLVINSLAAYSFARLQWRGKNFVFASVIALVILPFEAIAVPLFYMLNGQRNTVFVQFLPFIANAFSIYLFYTFFINLPKQVEEAARIDGAGPWKTFFYIVVPMSKPVFASVTILTFLAVWASFLWPVLMVSDPAARPLPLALSVFQGQPPFDWGQIMAFGVMMVLPVLIVFLIFQRWFVQSVASSGLKG